MSNANPVQAFIGQVLLDTEDFTNEEFGAYVRIVFQSRLRRRALVNDPKRIRLLLRCTPGRWLKKLLPVLIQHFETDETGELVDGVLRLRRHQQVIENAETGPRKSEKNAKNSAGKISGSPPKSPPSRTPKSGPKGGPDSRGGARDARADGEDSSGRSKNARPATEPESAQPNPLPATGLQKKSNGRSEGSGSGKFATQQARDEFAVQQCVPHLPGRDDGERWAVAMAAEDVKEPNHAAAVRAMLRAAKKAGVGWISPERRNSS